MGRLSTKSELLRLLETRRPQVLSGAEAAAQLGVSRAAVWKAAQSLRGEGHLVEAVAGKGYRLAQDSDVVTAEALDVLMAAPKAPVRVYDEVDSTNRVAKSWAMEGAPHGSWVVARRQTAGRGRLGRSFASPPGGLYLSMVLRPGQGVQEPGLVTSAAAVAVCRAVAGLYGIELGIKWVNDLFLSGKKCCGILTEAATDMESGAVDHLVVGIGLDVTTTDADLGEEVSEIATSLFPGGGVPGGTARLAAEIHRQVLALFGALPNRDFLAEYRARSTVLGRPVTVLATPPYRAQAVAIDDEARLVVRTQAGEQRRLAWGEISVRPEEQDLF
ncbi:MAG: biotin--[acetyl-CoA-carboxylase] ligase [Oscillospiraceae bacterium]